MWEEARTEAAVLAGTFADQIGAIVFDVPSDAKLAVVTLDGAIVDVTRAEPLPADPGLHVVRFAPPGGNAVERRTTVRPGETAHVSLAAARAESPYRVPMLAGCGVVGLGVVSGTLFGAVSLSHASSAKSACSSGRCPRSARGDIDGANGFGVASDIAFGIALAGAALSGFSMYMERRGAEPAQTAPHAGFTARPFVGLASVGITGELP